MPWYSSVQLHVHVLLYNLQIPSDARRKFSISQTHSSISLGIIRWSSYKKIQNYHYVHV